MSQGLPHGSQTAQVNLDNLHSVFSFVDGDASADYVCVICMGPLEQPTQIICQGVDEGHRVCKACLHRLIASGNRRCPRCNVPCAAGVKDALLERKMRQCEIKCDCCEWRGSWEDRLNHVKRCEEAMKIIGWRCPLEACSFTADTQREVELHLLAGFREHLDLARPVVGVSTLYPNIGCKDTAQVYIPDLAAFHAQTDSIHSPVFMAASGYCCTMAVTPLANEVSQVALRFCPAQCRHQLAPFPFDRPFEAVIVNPDQQAIARFRHVDHHLTLETRHTDANINPPVTQTSWTGGISTNFSRDDVHSLNDTHILFKLFVM